MANTYKNIVITPNITTNSTVVPQIVFSGGDATTNTDITLKVYTTSNGTLSFEGTAGQLFSVTNDLTGSIFSVNDVSGIPSIDVYANGNIYLAPYSGIVSAGSANLNLRSATQTEMEAFTSSNVIVTPANFDWHPAAAKFWVKADVAGAMQASYNMTSVTDAAVGQITLNIAQGFSSTNWVCLAMSYNLANVTSSGTRIVTANSGVAQATNTIRLTSQILSTTATVVDPINYFAVGFGDQP